MEDTTIDYSENPFWGIKLRYTWEKLDLYCSFKNSTLDDIDALSHMAFLWSQVPQEVVADAPKLNKFLDLNGVNTHYLSAGFEWSGESWDIMSEMDLWRIPSTLNSSIYSGYLSVGYHLGQFTPYGMVAFIYPELDKLTIIDDNFSQLPEDLQTLSVFSEKIYNELFSRQTSVSLGVRWDLSQYMDLKFQWDHSWLDKNMLKTLEIMENTTHNDTFNLFSISIDFIF